MGTQYYSVYWYWIRDQLCLIRMLHLLMQKHRTSLPMAPNSLEPAPQVSRQAKLRRCWPWTGKAGGGGDTGRENVGKGMCGHEVVLFQGDT